MGLEGMKAPDFDLEGSDGLRHSPGRYLGKTVVIYFYPKDNTPGCTKEACGFGEVYPELNSRGVVLLGVSKDSIASHGRFIAKFGLPFVLLSDPDVSMMKDYGAYGEKVMYGKRTEGIIRSTVVIAADGTVARHWQRVAKAETHPAEVASYLAGR